MDDKYASDDEFDVDEIDDDEEVPVKIKKMIKLTAELSIMFYFECFVIECFVIEYFN